MKTNGTQHFTFDTVRLEGSLFVADQLDKAAHGNATYQTTEDYHIPRGLRLTDEFGRAFQIAQAEWRQRSAYEAAHSQLDPAGAETFLAGLLRDALGYPGFQTCAPHVYKDRTYPIAFMAAEGLPLVIAPGGLELDVPDPRFAIEGSGHRKKSAAQLAQEYLNAGGARWALVSNGNTLRLLRASPSLVRPSWLEFDLRTILEEARYPDFCALYRILHGSRAIEVWETWRTEGVESGIRVREKLRDGVTQALRDLGNGFLKHLGTGNDALRESLKNGSLKKDDYFRQLLRLIYRFLFIFTAEDRGLIHASPEGECRGAKELYARGYALSRLRDRALRRSGWDTYTDQWEGVRIVFRALVAGEPTLDLPALGGLFSTDQCPDLDACGLPNRALLSAMFNLRWTVAGDARLPVNYGLIGPEELGSVYESLLELVPVLNMEVPSFGFVGDVESGSIAGNARKTTGSYYTPEFIVQELVTSTLDPVIERKLATSPGLGEQAILSITVCDPACGSGHFLLAAGRRLAERLAALRSPDGAVLPADYRHALRQIVGSCLYGVDLNPMAVELARTALWLEGYEPGRPLSFLDHHIRCGNSLVGMFDLEVLKDGIPDAAYAALSGDDPAVARSLKKRNANETREVRLRQGLLFEDPIQKAEATLTQLHWHLNRTVEDTVQDVDAKKRRFAELAHNPAYLGVKTACDLWVAAFFAPKQAGLPVPTTHDVSQAAAGAPATLWSAGSLEYSGKIAADNMFFHWRLEFPEIFANHGFDCVLGNPPWDVSQLNEEEYFSSKLSSIAMLSGDRRKQAIVALAHKDPILWNEYLEVKHSFEAANIFYRESSRYELTAVGKINLYALFAELIAGLYKERGGGAGFIVPSGIATDDSTKGYFSMVARHGRIVSLFDFENRKGIFPAVDSRVKFCLITLGSSEQADFAFFLTDSSQLQDARRHFVLGPSDFASLNPNTLTCPVFRSVRDAEITRGIYARVPILIDEREGIDEHKGNPWRIAFKQGLFNMTSDSGLFQNSPNASSLPLYEAKMIHQFDHRWATYDVANTGASGRAEPTVRDVSDAMKEDLSFSVRPRYWVDRREVIARIADAPKMVIDAWRTHDERELRAALATQIDTPELVRLSSSPDLFATVEAYLDAHSPKWLMGWRRNARSNDERTLIATVVSKNAIGDSIFLLFPKKLPTYSACLLGNLNCIVLDFIARQKLGGVNFSFYYLRQLPVLPPEAYSDADLSFIVPRVFELTYTAKDMQPWAAALWGSMDTRLRVFISQRYREQRGQYRRIHFFSYGLPSQIEDPALVWPHVERNIAFNGDSYPPFPWVPERRAVVRAELDARYARLYGLTREELSYILDPASVMGPDYPSETFRVLKDNEIREFGEYRTMRLVLEAWDAQESATGSAYA